MKRILLFLAVLAALALPMTARAASLDDANEAFSAGRFAESTKAYEDVLKTNGYSASVLFDLGNSQFREGNFPEAILAYKRALWLAPDDADIAANLKLAQEQAGTEIDKAPAYAAVTSALSVNGWAWLACAAWVLVCGCLLMRKVWPQRNALLVTGAVLGGFVLVDAITAIALSSGDLREAVVVDKNPQALIAPFAGSNAQPGFTPAPGETLHIEKAHNGFLRVTDRAGHAGWMASSELAPVVK